MWAVWPATCRGPLLSTRRCPGSSRSATPLSGQPFGTALELCLLLVVFCWVAPLFARGHGWLDRLWSLCPPVYCLLVAAEAFDSARRTRKQSDHQRRVDDVGLELCPGDELAGVRPAPSGRTSVARLNHASSASGMSEVSMSSSAIAAISASRSFEMAMDLQRDGSPFWNAPSVGTDGPVPRRDLPHCSPTSENLGHRTEKRLGGNRFGHVTNI